MGEILSVPLGHHNICPLLEQFHVASMTQSELSSLISLKVWDDPEKFWSDITFLLVLTKECTVGERVYSLAMIWANPYQAKVSSMAEVIKWLTLLTSTGSNWPYILVQLNGDACHVPLPTEEHLSIMVKGSTSSVPCRGVSQLEVHQLLSLGSQLVYLVGLNGCQVPLITSLPKLLARGANILGGKPASLPVDVL